MSITRLPEAPQRWHIYRNAGSDYMLATYSRVFGAGHVVRADGWSCDVHNPRLYQMEDGSVELQWDWSSHGKFDPAKQQELKDYVTHAVLDNPPPASGKEV